MIGQDARLFGAESEVAAAELSDDGERASTPVGRQANRIGTVLAADLEAIRREALAALATAAPVWQASTPHGYLVEELRLAIERAHPATLRQFAQRARTELVSAR